MAEKKKSPRGSEFWQILFPALLGAAMILAFGIWFGLTGSTGSLSRFGEISVILLVIPLFIISLLIGFLMARFISLINKLIGVIPLITERVLGINEKVRDRVKWGSRSLARLVIEPIAFWSFLKWKRNLNESEIILKD